MIWSVIATDGAAAQNAQTAEPTLRMRKAAPTHAVIYAEPGLGTIDVVDLNSIVRRSGDRMAAVMTTVYMRAARTDFVVSDNVIDCRHRTGITEKEIDYYRDGQTAIGSL